MKPLSLNDLCPEDSEFTLSDSGKTYTIRKFTLADQAWLQRTFGGTNAVQQAFADVESLIRIVFHQIPVEQQKEFSPKRIESVNEDTGEVVAETLGGWRLFATNVTNHAKDIQSIAEALTRSIVGSNAVLDDAPVEQKKTAEELTTGGPSLTSSHQSTATASIQSGA